MIERLVEHRDDLHQIPRETLAAAARQLSERLSDAARRLLDGFDPYAAPAAVEFKAAA